MITLYNEICISFLISRIILELLYADNNIYYLFILKLLFFSQSFMSDMRNSWLLPSHPNVSRVLAACSQGDPVCVVSEWVLPGDDDDVVTVTTDDDLDDVEVL